MSEVEDYECEYCGGEHPNFHYCTDCGEEIDKAECFYSDGLCKECYIANKELND